MPPAESGATHDDGSTAPASDITVEDPRLVQMLFHGALERAVVSVAGLQRDVHPGGDVPVVPLDVDGRPGLLGQGTGFSRSFAIIAAGVLAFDLVVGLTTYLRIGGAGYEDLIAIHGMSRIRHAYTEIARRCAPTSPRPSTTTPTASCRPTAEPGERRSSASSHMSCRQAWDVADPRHHDLRGAEEEIARLTEAVKEQAIELAMLRGKQRGAW